MNHRARQPLRPTVRSSQDKQHAHSQFARTVGLRTALTVAGGLTAVAAFIVLAADSLGYWHWGDEDEKIVAGWMIAEGYRLYDTLFAHHGALNYALAHLAYLNTGSVQLAPYRILQWGTVLLAGAALAASPLICSWRQRVIAFSGFILSVALLGPLWYGHTLLYHSLGGVAISVALSLLVLPVMFAVKPSPVQAGLGGAALSAAVFAAYPFALPAVLLPAAALAAVRARGVPCCGWRPTLLPATAGFGVFTLLMLLWLARYGDILGYAIYHFWLNQAVYANFIHYDVAVVVTQLEVLFQSPLGWALQAGVLFSLLLLVEAWAVPDHDGGGDLRRRLWLAAAWALFLLGLLFLNPRGEVIYKNAALWIVGLGLLNLLIVWTPRRPGNTVAVAILRGLALVVAIAAPTYLIGVKGWSDVDARYVTRAHAEEMRAGYAQRIRLVQALVPANEPMLAMVFSPRWYLLAERLPSSGAYYYLPWQAAYNHGPVLGYRIDPCADLAAAPPKVIAWDRWRVWERYDVADYAPCLVEIVRQDYLAITRTPLLLRKPVSDADRAIVTELGFDLMPVAN